MKRINILGITKTSVAHHAVMFGLLAALIALASCSGTGPKKDAPAAAGPGAGAGSTAAAVFAVSTTFAEEGALSDYLALSGDIVAGSSVDAYSDAAGKVTRLYVSVGQQVSRNDPLAAVDPSRPGMTYNANIVRSPIGGTVTQLPAQLGMTVSQAVPIARIAGGNALEIKLYVAERFISKIALTQPCEITLDAWPGEVFRGSIREMSPVVDPASRTMEIKVNVENPGSKLKAGMFAKVKVITERKDGVVKIPESAVVNRFGESYIFIVEADRSGATGYVARRRDIKPGITVDGILEVQDGLKSGEEVVVKGQTLLEDGAHVNVIK